jgi:uncharacterized zinc-type alcohol dehydrogenase-like protein
VHNSRKDGALKKLGRSLDLIISTINAPPDVSAFLDTLAPKGSFHNVGAVLKPLEVPAFSISSHQQQRLFPIELIALRRVQISVDKIPTRVKP